MDVEHDIQNRFATKSADEIVPQIISILKKLTKF